MKVLQKKHKNSSKDQVQKRKKTQKYKKYVTGFFRLF